MTDAEAAYVVDLREALRDCIATAAECRRWLGAGMPFEPGSAGRLARPDPIPYGVYRRTWDASMAADQRAQALLDRGPES